MSSKKVLVLAGGRGTRLQEVLKGLPKPLANINGIPFISFLISKLIAEGYKNFIFSLYFNSEKLIEYLEQERFKLLKGCSIEFCVEAEPLGTGGAISFVVSKLRIKGFFLVVNADSLLENGYFLVGQSECNAIGLVKVKNISRYGKVAFDETFMITNFYEKSEISEPGFINAGIYHLHSDLFENYTFNKYSLEKEMFPKLVESRSLKAVLLESSFIDIGVPDDYNKFCLENNSK